MKRNVLNVCLLIFILSLVSCEKSDVIDGIDASKECKVSFSFFDYGKEPLKQPRLQSLKSRKAPEKSVYFRRIDMALFRKSDNKLCYRFSRSDNSADNFGRIDTLIASGDYCLIAIASRAQGVVDIESPQKVIFPFGKATDMVYICTNITVDQKHTSFSEEMQHGVCQFRMIPSDASLATDRAIHVTMGSNCSSIFNPSTGLGIKQETPYNVTLKFTEVKAGITIDTYAFLTSEKVTTNIQVDILNANDVIRRSLVFSDVELQVSYSSHYTGPVFNDVAGFDFTQYLDAPTFIKGDSLTL